jgi:predicted nucleic acid-binding Zn ribbon protein
MSFNSLSGLLGHLQQNPYWEHLRYYQQTLRAWHRVVTPEISAHTRPLAVRQGVLWVATASPVWAQTLALQRPGLLAQLNPHLTEPLQDLRFSPGQWYQWRPPGKVAPAPATSSSPPALPNQTLTEGPVTIPTLALARWLSVMEQRCQILPSCPQCQAPTDPQALDRWSVCACCARQRWTKTLPQRRDQDSL